jgi:hypothetical protein
MALKFRDPVAIKHPSAKGFQLVSRRSFESAWSQTEVPWVEASSAEAKAAVAKATRPPQVDATPTSKEEPKP